MDPVLNDLRYAFRTLRKNPGFTLTAILSIALAIGANSTIFSYADGLLLRPLPVPNASGVVTLRSIPPTVTSLPLRGAGEMSYPDLEDFRRSSRAFDGLLAYDEIVAALAVNPKAPAQFILGYQVSGDFFRVLRVDPQLGRAFTTEEDAVEGRDAVVVLSHDLWKSEFAADPTVIGRPLRLNGLEFTVIGVAPESFTGMDQFLRPGFFIPIAKASKLYPEMDGQRTDRNRRTFIVKGRLKPGTSVRSAAQEVSTLAKLLEQSFPATNRGFGATVNTELEMRLINTPLLGGLVGALFTVAIVILMVACANVANLMLGRGRARAREIAVRRAVGAGRGELVRLLLIESLLIASVSGALALFASQFTAGIFSAMELPADVPVHLTFRVDTRVLWFTAIVSVSSAILFGLLPALQSTRPDLVSVMKAGELDNARKRFVGRHALVMVQIAGSIILMILTTEGRRNFNEMLATNPGFRRDHRITMRFNPLASGYSNDQSQRLYDTLAKRSLELTGVRSAGLTSALPMTFDLETRAVAPEGYEFPAGRESVEILSYVVDYRYLGTMDVPILAGRGFRETDNPNSPRVAVVNDAFAKEYLGQNPIGKRLRMNDRNGPEVEVIGVTMTGKTFSLFEPPVQAIYLPLSQNPWNRMTLVVETAGDSLALAGPLQEMVRSIDPNISVFRVRTMEDLFERSTVNTIRMVGRIYDSAAGLALVLALVGLYAVVSYQVTRRTREIGIRMALGAEQFQVMKMFLKQATLMSLIGVSLGLVLSAFANHVGESSFGPSPLHPLMVVTVCLSMFLITLAASLIPARRAARIDPQRALRQE
jgi:predicted permease